MDAIRLGQISAHDLIREQQAGKSADGSFAEMLQQGYDHLQETRTEADQQVKDLLAGKSVDLHRVIMAGEQAGLAFELAQAVRNKVVDAYQEVMRMQV